MKKIRGIKRLKLNLKCMYHKIMICILNIEIKINKIKMSALDIKRIYEAKKLAKDFNEIKDDKVWKMAYDGIVNSQRIKSKNKKLILKYIRMR